MSTYVVRCMYSGAIIILVIVLAFQSRSRVERRRNRNEVCCGIFMKISRSFIRDRWTRLKARRERRSAKAWRGVAFAFHRAARVSTPRRHDARGAAIQAKPESTASTVKVTKRVAPARASRASNSSPTKARALIFNTLVLFTYVPSCIHIHQRVIWRRKR